MSRITHQTDYHITYNTKYRRKVLVEQITRKTEEIIRGIAIKRGCQIKEIKIMPDHVHLLISIPPQYKISEIVRQIKGASSYYLFREFPEIKTKLRKGHLWAPSYFVRATGDVTIGTIRKYIENQEGKHAL